MTIRVLAASAAIGLCALCVRAKTFGDDDGGFVYRGTRIGITPETATVIASGRTLADYDVRYSYFKAVPDGQIAMVDGVALPYCQHWETVGSTDTYVVEFQRYNHRESQIYCVEACFFQDGDNIRAYARRAMSCVAYGWRLGENFADLLAAGTDPHIRQNYLATDSRKGMGLTHFLFERKPLDVVRPSAASDVTGGFEVKRGTDLVIEKTAYESAAGFLSCQKTVDGVLTLRNLSANRTFTGPFAGSEGGEIRVELSGPGGTVVTCGGPGQVIMPESVILRDCPIWAATNVTAVNGGTVNARTPMNFKAYFFTQQTDYLQFQLHAMGTYGGKSCLYAGRFKLERLDGDDVKISNLYCKGFRYVMADNENAIKLSSTGKVEPGALNPFDGSLKDKVDYFECAWPATADGGGCNLAQLTLAFKDVATTQVFKGANLIPAGGVLRVRGLRGAKAAMQINSIAAVPTNGTVFVEEGGRFEINCSGDAAKAGIGGNRTEIFVSTNGELAIVGGNYPFGSGRPYDNEAQKIYVDGGKFTGTSSKNGTINVSRLYVGRLTLANGAYATGPAQWRVGRGAVTESGTNFVWYVTGHAPSKFDAGWALQGQSKDSGYGTEHFLINVDDVTEDADPDFIVGGETLPDREQWSGSYSCTPLIKVGKGTMSFTGVFRSDAPLRIEEGKVLLAKSDAFVTQTPVPVVLAGGGLSTAVNTENNAGTLAVLGKAGVTNQLVVAEGAKIAFADSSAVAWDPGARLMITGTVGPQTIRFGTDANGLTPQQRRQIRINGDRGRGHLDANGYLVDDGIPGAIMIVR